MNFVGRGGHKLQHALSTFSINPAGWTCADLGCNVGGFTDCLLQLGASRIFAVDTGYGALAWKLRNDPRIVVMERTNALHAPPPEPVDLVVVDLGWTPQRHALPAARAWLKPFGCIISLIKPHYEVPRQASRELLRNGVLDEAEAQRTADRVLAEIPELGFDVRAATRSPIAGGASKGNKHGNAEWLALLYPRAGA